MRRSLPASIAACGGQTTTSIPQITATAAEVTTTTAGGATTTAGSSLAEFTVNLSGYHVVPPPVETSGTRSITLNVNLNSGIIYKLDSQNISGGTQAQAFMQASRGPTVPW